MFQQLPHSFLQMSMILSIVIEATICLIGMYYFWCAMYT